MVWEPKTCCCGASPKTGTLVLGWLGVIFSALNAAGLLRFVNITQSEIYAFCGDTLKNVNPDVMTVDTCAQIYVGSIAFTAIASLLGLLICGLLLWGVNKYKPCLMLPYLIIKGFGLTLSGLFMLVMLILLAYAGQWVVVLILTVILGGLMFLDVYLFLVVRVCYKEVKQHSMAMTGVSDIVYVEQKDVLYKM